MYCKHLYIFICYTEKLKLLPNSRDFYEPVLWCFANYLLIWPQWTWSYTKPHHMSWGNAVIGKHEVRWWTSPRMLPLKNNLSSWPFLCSFLQMTSSIYFTLFVQWLTLNQTFLTPFMTPGLWREVSAAWKDWGFILPLRCVFLPCNWHGEVS